MAEHPPYRLPHSVIPTRYDLEICPDLRGGTFQGTARITIDVRDDVQEMVINALDLIVHDVTLNNATGQEIAAQFSYRPEEEQLVLSWPRPISPGQWTLILHYDGTLGDDLRGFYRTTVKNPDGTTTIFAVTQCEATDARQVFPGWDEPEFKAIYSLTLLIEPGLAALSNARQIASQVDPDGKHRITFADTIPMSSYLVAIVIGPYEWTQPTMVGKIPVRIAARPSQMHLTSVAARTAPDMLRFFEKYFAIPYPGDKLDHIAVPEFEAGAMENLGLVTYRDEYLLIDPDRASQAEHMNLVSIMAHETAHMWFGDLVTMRWWNGIWLNEAFATFMQNLATEALHPEWDPWTTFSHGRSYAMTIDGLKSSRPIEFAVGRPSESWAMFDVLTYQKGGSVLRMLEQYLGPETFRQGISQYLDIHRLANTETSDLWNALESVSDQPVRSMMDTWVFQAGHPIITAEWNAEDGQLTVSQQQFLYSGTGDGRWQVPMTVKIRRQNGSQTIVRLILENTPVSIPLPPDWALVNVNDGGWGFYRATYDQTLWQRLVTSLESLTAIERFQIVDDAWATVLADNVPLSHIVPLWRALQSERDPDVWSAVAKNMEILDIIADTNDRSALQSLIVSIAQPVLDAIGWEPKPDEEGRQARLRGVVVSLLGISGEDRAVQSTARKLWQQYLDGHQVPPDLLTPIVRIVATTGDSNDWDALYAAFKKSPTPQDEARYLYALARFSDAEQIDRSLALYLSDDVRLQYAPIALGQALMSRHSSEMAWQVIESHWDQMLHKYPKNMMKHIVQAIPYLTDEALANRAINWLDTHPVAEVARLIDQVKEFQRVNQRFAHRIRGHMTTLLT